MPIPSPPPELALAMPTIDGNTGWWSTVRCLASPHVNERPLAEVSAIVVHNISLPPGLFGGNYIDDLFMGRLDPQAHPYFAQISHLRVSAHACIFRDGSVTQYVPVHQRAWHAGVSRLDGVEGCNDFSIGIELEGDDFSAFTDAQYRSLSRLIVAAQAVYPQITTQRIVGHSDIAPGRKTDPGPFFDWQRLLALLEHPR